MSALPHAKKVEKLLTPEDTALLHSVLDAARLLGATKAADLEALVAHLSKLEACCKCGGFSELGDSDTCWPCQQLEAGCPDCNTRETYAEQRAQLSEYYDSVRGGF